MNEHGSSSELTDRSFELLAPAGSGGAGEVWRARARRDGTLVALKVARDAAAREAIAREARHAILALSPRLPELVDVGWFVRDGDVARAIEAGDDRAGERFAFVALRWVEGATLRERAREAGVDRTTLALAVARDAGEALSDLHEVGLAHGDIKPENVLLGWGGRAHVIDLGLACPVYTARIEGGTPRYLARGDAALGDARARDLVAFGALLAELVDDAVAASEQPIEAARAARLPEPIALLCEALLSPSPGARPPASWVAETARAALAARDAGSGREREERGERDARRVRAAYLSARRDELVTRASAGAGTAAWLGDALAWARRARSLVDAESSLAQDAGASEIGPLGPEGIARWMTSLVGSPAAAWPTGPLAKMGEASLAAALVDLARKLPPAAWTFADVEGAALGRTPTATTPERPTSAPFDIEEVARLSIAIAAVPPDPMAIERVERGESAPASLLVAAADALRLSGELGRARSLVLRARERRAKGADALAAEILRRAGELGAAREIAAEADRRGEDPDGKARAILARIAFDERRYEEAEALVQGATSVPAYEVAALVASTRGDTERALASITRGEAIARRAEEHARIAALRGYVEHGGDPARTRSAFAAAVEHATRAGAVVEEATYRTGEAAAAVDLGDLGGAITTARRAALLWEHLGRPALAARALLARAAAHATAGVAHEAERVAREAIARAREGRDTRAEAYALWAIADVSPRGAAEGRRAAEQARALLADASGDDKLRASARLLRHAEEALDLETCLELDRLAETPSLTAGARLDWWRARAEVLLAASGELETRTAEHVLGAIVALSDARAPVWARGPSIAAGYALAARVGRGDVAVRLLSSLGDAARDLLSRASPELAPSIRALPWVAQAAAAPQEGMRAEQARELEQLIVSLSDRERLRSLLDRVVDALVLWTGVERGLLLLRAPDGRLVARAARNLARADLRDEQLSLSQTLARRALAALEPVVAVDAAGEMPAVHVSVHALKLRSVLVVPLVARGEALGVVYLDDRVRRGAFGPRELAWTRTVATIAALAIADARDQALLRRAARKAKRASAALEETLARREAALDVAERELNRTRGTRETRFEYNSIIGESEPVRAMLRLVDRVTTADVPVLIHGESGSGKELVARAIHDNGPRAGHPFVGENCGAIPEGLLESTLFGHVRGAFTGADRPRSGLFEASDRGTLFLDEIGEMSLGMQAKLLRVLQDGMVRPLGTERARKVDVRIVAATHRDLDAMVRARTFREDLYYRLNIITIRIPPLRERASDVPLLVKHLLAKYGRSEVRVTRAAMDRLMAFPWPGNIRQLENEVRRALLLCDGVIEREHLSPEIANVTPPVPVDLGLRVRPRVDALEAQLVREALERTKGNQTQAAKLLGLSRFGLQKMMKRLSVSS
ncbi:sigma 54-interacting transcriptional regulator [Polyangium sp. y55x31]|uniref:sigma 54-interacting transcriptional regulator n=1 Tax=Polyangium sp. y55x31 TaxID=3042688 RepID=UPI002482CF5B|nr:sigma 54-interacting transcriptional regulator [Polyangium sp. y55x31]MDI1482175.1 sigma 54-interacting transcriptional regulator [Polyangium sp. y55x31]